MNKNRQLGFGALALLVSALASGCSNMGEGNPGDSSPPAVSASPSSSATAESVDMESVFDATAAKSADQFWRAHPELMPKSVASAELVLNEKFTGPGTFKLPAINKSESIIVVLTCTSKVSYEVVVLDANNGQKDLTGGESCGGPNINSYRTSPFKVDSEKDVVKVIVPAGTGYYITAYRSTT